MYKTVSKNIQRGREREKVKPLREADPRDVPQGEDDNSLKVQRQRQQKAERQRCIPIISNAVKTGVRLRELVPARLRQEIAQAGGPSAWLKRFYLKQGRQSRQPEPKPERRKDRRPYATLLNSPFETNRRRH
jgi:hypothetical protein